MNTPRLQAHRQIACAFSGWVHKSLNKGGVHSFRHRHSPSFQNQSLPELLKGRGEAFPAVACEAQLPEETGPPSLTRLLAGFIPRVAFSSLAFWSLREMGPCGSRRALERFEDLAFARKPGFYSDSSGHPAVCFAGG